MKRILIIDDEKGPRDAVEETFRSTHIVLKAENASQALQVLQKDHVDLILLDIVMPEKDGMKFLQELRVLYPDLPVIMVSAVTSTRTMAEAIRLGAVDFISKPFEAEDLCVIAEQALAHTSVRRQMEANRREQVIHNPAQTMIGETMAFQHVLHKCLRQTSRREPLLIEGEPGTGKKLLARHIHNIGDRSNQPFIAFRCSALPEHLHEVELFGQNLDKPSMTSEMETMGRIDLASSGTIVLEDAHVLAAPLQEKLVRIIKEKVFCRAYSNEPVKTDARLIFVRTIPCEGDSEVESPKFTSQLEELLAENSIVVPALRNRKEDIPLIAYYFLNQYRKQMNAVISDIDSEAMEKLREHYWPGNIVELKNIIEHAIIVHGGEKTLKFYFLPEEIRGKAIQFDHHDSEVQGSLEEMVNAFQRKIIIAALTKARGRQVGAARILKTTPRILNHRIKQLNIKTVAK
ncbi:MAG: sigma-54 dependent transcriptional regulator [Verrucomicrobiota bacterium]